MSITKEAAAKLAQKWAAKKAAMLQTAPVYHKLVDAEVPAAVDVVNAALADFEAPAPAPVNRLSDADNWAMYQAGEGDFAPEYIDFMCQKFIGALDEPEDEPANEPENEDLLARYVDILMRAKSGMEVDAADFDEALCNTVEQPDGSWTLNEDNDDDLPEPESDDDDDDSEADDDISKYMFAAVLEQLLENVTKKTVYNPKISVAFTNEQFAMLSNTAPLGEKRTQPIGVSVGNVQFTVNIEFIGTA